MLDSKVLTIQDYSSFGQCSLSVALPIISAMGIETVSLPIALLSTHTSGFDGYTYVDLKDNVVPATKHYKSLGLNFDFIYLGYLGSSATAKAVEEVCNLFPDAQLIVDPAMAENGEFYDGITQDFVESIATLCKKSYIALPNLSEACLLSGVEYSRIQTKKSVLNICQGLTKTGIKRFVITGIRMEDGMRLAYYDNNIVKFIDTKEVKGDFLGSGDVFASALVGALANNLDLPQSLDLAVEYTQRTIEITSQDKEHWYGLKFEKTIPHLLTLLNQAKTLDN
ncbi:MAG: bifunctional hydroxymethylpyrimidine kinase/phosphomethylpyrimidine kinase [Clostridia bacterium]|nr:bifunctional hydroxymethylpyrimidine kinase/phosphomethylpyrimidine kinase [Clostridia bacterium]